ncbi:hypothetical protein BJ875DRAFT_276074 [Amylocarpus encephaloides]|uniref:Uncharacterized protein n=1 Tax=Amylocarpus encephaloides TaxID=45428 RepID=A0A9P8CBA5_9HELO|nr:hypothetical protein BJ875DRAFT_276074 [Amylocarpus encephaloides]
MMYKCVSSFSMVTGSVALGFGPLSGCGRLVHVAISCSCFDWRSMLSFSMYSLYLGVGPALGMAASGPSGSMRCRTP